MTSGAGHSPAVLDFINRHGINAQIAELAGFAADGDAITFRYSDADGDYRRSRHLPGGKTIQPKGRKLSVWKPIPIDGPLLVGEGESDFLALASAIYEVEDADSGSRLSRRSDLPPPIRGLTPVAMPGAGNCHDEVVSLAGHHCCDVVIAFDGDEAGRTNAEKLAKKIAASGVSVGAAIVPMPEGKDIADILAAVEVEDRVGALANLVAEAESWRDDIPADGADGKDGDSHTQSNGKGPSQATILVNLALGAGAQLFHSPDGIAYATLPIERRRETWPLRTKSVKRWLSRLFYEQTQKVPGSQAVADALGVLEGQALFDGVEEDVHVRVASFDGAIYLDLADADWRAIEITAAGWRVVSDPPVRFVRSRGMLALPEPERGGSLLDLHEFVNFDSQADFRLMVMWLVMTLRPAGPYPVLALHGEQGSGKSTTAEMLRSLVDPNQALLRPPPRDERDLVIAGNNSRVIGLENLSAIPLWLSDALCRISTGSGFATRELYSDAEETIFSVQLPIILNGIVEVVTKGDLQDRSVVLSLPRIEGYVSEDDLWRRFDAARPRLLAGLLDVVSHALANEADVVLPDPPRMADFARWTAAAAPALGWDADETLAAYASNRADANDVTLDASPLVPPLRLLGEFEGSAADLLDQLGELAGEKATRSKVWPKSPSALSGGLRRLAPNLRRSSPPIEIEFARVGHERHRVIRVAQLDEVCKTASAASAPSALSFATDDEEADLERVVAKFGAAA